MGIIYCYTNLINSKKYIGQTINPRQRFNQHKSSAFNPKDDEYEAPLHRAFRKYGFENFKYEVLAEAETIEELNKLEIYYISYYNTRELGYNIEPGEKNCSKPMKEETKQKLSLIKGSFTEEEVIYLREAYRDHKSPSEIYKEKYAGKMHYYSFLNIWTGSRYKHIMPEVFEGKSHTKLTYEIAQAIREEYNKGGISYKKLAEKYNISSSTVADIMHQRTWKTKK